MYYGFIAKPCNFQGENGYVLDQYYQGRIVCSQFLPESSFDSFCSVAGIKPIIERVCNAPWQSVIIWHL